MTCKSGPETAARHSKNKRSQGQYLTQIRNANLQCGPDAFLCSTCRGSGSAAGRSRNSARRRKCVRHEPQTCAYFDKQVIRAGRINVSAPFRRQERSFEYLGGARCLFPRKISAPHASGGRQKMHPVLIKQWVLLSYSNPA